MKNALNIAAALFQFDRPAVTALQASSKLSKHRVLKFEKSAISETPKYFLKGIEQSYYTSRIRKPGRGNYAHMYSICLMNYYLIFLNHMACVSAACICDNKQKDF